MWIEVTDFNDGDRFPGSKIVRLGELNVLIVNQVHLYHTAVLKQLFLLFLSLQSLFFFSSPTCGSCPVPTDF